ncbi:MAG: hypothetical protein CMI71_04445 [Candidatus Pelagibacter sp.]|nr:hypothetical protein [Candidatus Pelagibacter sp.]RPG11025.1 MAG: hypothetical protein CBD30_002325 [Pelagibacteraceae bacterium TMED170]
MRKIFVYLFLLFFASSCSFDNKSGIWTDGSKTVVSDIGDLEKNKNFPTSELEDVFPTTKLYQEEQKVLSNIKIELNPIIKNKNWLETFLTNGNNIENINYTNTNRLIFKSSKLSKFSKLDYKKKKILVKPLVYNDNLISFDHKGSIYIYSIRDKKKIFEYNFYKKKFKRYKKNIYLSVSDETIFVADNLGYVYALDIKTEKIVWAKNYGIPFRSNIKIANNQIFLANQDNTIYSLNKKDGEKLWQFSTQPSFYITHFVNNLAVDKTNQNIFFLNTSGELYSINYMNRNINWLLNFNKSAQKTENEIFNGLPIVTNKKNLIISNGAQLSNYSFTDNNVTWQSSITSNIKPIITKNNIFVVTNNNFLICLNTLSGEVVWSKNIIKYIQQTKKSWNFKKTGFIQNFAIADGVMLMFTSKGYLFSVELSSGDLIDLKKISRGGFGSVPIFSNGYLYVLDNNYKLLKYE